MEVKNYDEITFSGVAGLKTHQTKMDVIGNNIANVNTTGLKSSSVLFSDVLYQTSANATGATATTGVQTHLRSVLVPRHHPFKHQSHRMVVHRQQTIHMI